MKHVRKFGKWMWSPIQEQLWLRNILKVLGSIHPIWMFCIGHAAHLLTPQLLLKLNMIASSSAPNKIPSIIPHCLKKKDYLWLLVILLFLFIRFIFYIDNPFSLRYEWKLVFLLFKKIYSLLNQCMVFIFTIKGCPFNELLIMFIQTNMLWKFFFTKGIEPNKLKYNHDLISLYDLVYVL